MPKPRAPSKALVKALQAAAKRSAQRPHDERPPFHQPIQRFFSWH